VLAYRRLFQYAIAFVWIATAVSVIHPQYRVIGAGYLIRLSLPVWLMYMTCAGEFALGLRVAFGAARSWITLLQVSLILSFTLLLALAEPKMLVHPFGMLTKNIPMVALIIAVWRLEKTGWDARSEWILRFGMAAIWITEGLFPKVLFQTELELAVVRGSGLVPFEASQFLMLLGAAQVISGVLVLVLAGRLQKFILVCQFAALIALPLLVSWQDPTLWVHPFGPMTKNIPILAGTWVLLVHGSHTVSEEVAV